MLYVDIPEGTHEFECQRVEYSESHVFPWPKDRPEEERMKPAVRFIVEATSAEKDALPELVDGDEAWGRVWSFWQEVKGNGIWRPAYPESKTPSLRAPGTYGLYKNWVRGMVGLKAAELVIELAKAGGWRWEFLVGTIFRAKVIHKESGDKTFVNLVRFAEADEEFDFDNTYACTRSIRDYEERNLKLLREASQGPNVREAAARYLNRVLVPIVRGLNEWDSGLFQQAKVFWHDGTAVTPTSLTAKIDVYGEKFAVLEQTEQLMIICELAKAINECIDGVPDPPEALGGVRLWDTDTALNAPLWEGYKTTESTSWELPKGEIPY